MAFSREHHQDELTGRSACKPTAAINLRFSIVKLHMADATKNILTKQKYAN